jgi:hypothetical protein
VKKIAALFPWSSAHSGKSADTSPDTMTHSPLRIDPGAIPTLVLPVGHRLATLIDNITG